MIELPDDELDKLFRKSSEELDPTFDPGDWNEMSKRLDQQDGKTPGAWWRKWWPLGVLALLIPAGIALYFWSSDREEQLATEQDQVLAKVGEAVTVEKENAVVAHKEKAEDPLAATSEKSIAGSVSEKKKNSDGKAQNAASKLKISDEEIAKSSSKSALSAAGKSGSRLLPRSQSKAGGVYLEPNRSKVEGGDGAFSKTNVSAADKVQAGNAKEDAGNSQARKGNAGSLVDAVPGQDAQVNAVEVQEAPDAVNAEDGRLVINAGILSHRPVSWKKPVLPDVKAPDVPEPVTEPEPVERDQSQEQPKWAVRFGYSPDLSTVGLKDFTKPGTAVSLFVEYAILPRLYLQSGAVWSRKEYYAPADAYQLPKIPYYYPPEMESVEGFCKVLEVPLNLRYDISQSQRSRWFVGGGFSNYHMNKERYKYNFVNEYDPNIKSRSWQGKTGWYWLSHLNASVGYEYRISRKLSLLAEPSVRIPLKRVGYGKVNLVTTGIWLSVRYIPVFK